MNAEQLSSQPSQLDAKFCEGRYHSWRLKGDVLGDRPRGRRAAKRTVLEIGVTLRMVVMPVVGRSAATGRA